MASIKATGSHRSKAVRLQERDIAVEVVSNLINRVKMKRSRIMFEPVCVRERDKGMRKEKEKKNEEKRFIGRIQVAGSVRKRKSSSKNVSRSTR